MATDVRTESYICIVCDEPADPKMSAECNWCDGRYHLNQRNDIVAKDCGQVWIDEQYMALQFACDNCLGGRGAPRAGAATTRSIASRVETGRRRRYRRRA